MDNEEKTTGATTTFKCESCGSKADGVGTCDCGAGERKEVCATCEHGHKEDGTCGADGCECK